MSKSVKNTRFSAKMLKHILDIACAYVNALPGFTARRDNSVATKRNLVEILRFRHFSRHVVFDAEGDKFRNKRIEDYITVSVVIDMECGNTKN